MHFSDTTIDKNKTDLHKKNTDTGKFFQINFNLPWNYKISWIKSLYHQVEKIGSSSKKCRFQMKKIKTFMWWNGYTLFTDNSIIKPSKSFPKKVKRWLENNMDKVTIPL